MSLPSPTWTMMMVMRCWKWMLHRMTVTQRGAVVEAEGPRTFPDRAEVEVGVVAVEEVELD